MNKYLIIIMFLFSVGTSTAQETKTLSLKQAIEYGLINRYDIQSARKDVELAKNNIEQTKQALLPDINIKGDARYNSQLQTSIFPDSQSPSGSSEVKFGTKNNTTIGIELDQTLFDPSYGATKKTAELELEQDKVALEEKRFEAKYNISQAYYKALYYQGLLKVKKEESKLYFDLLNISKARYEGGEITENEYLKQKLNYQNAMMEEENAKSDLNMAIYDLKSAINYNGNEPLQLTETFDLPLRIQQPGQDTINYTIRKLTINDMINQASLKSASMSRLPTISLYGNYTQQYQGDDFTYNGYSWNPYNYIGVRLNIPLTNSLTFFKDNEKYKIQQQQYKIDKETEIQNIKQEIKKYLEEVTKGENQIEYLKQNQNLARKILDIDIQQYKIGEINYSDLLDSENTFFNASLDLLQSKYDLMKAYLNYNKAKNIK